MDSEVDNSIKNNQDELKDNQSFDKPIDHQETSNLLFENQNNIHRNLQESLSCLQNDLDILRIKEFKDLPSDFKLTININKVTNQCQEIFKTIEENFQLLADSKNCLKNINCIINEKISNDGLYAWINKNNDYNRTINDKTQTESATSIDEDETVKSTKAKLELAKDNELIANSVAEISRLLNELNEAELNAQRSIEEGRKGRERFELARLAEEKKAKEEEENRIKAENERVRKEEEERKKREELERRKRIKDDKNNNTDEDLAKKNPVNWPMFVYSLDPGDIDIPIGCVIRSMLPINHSDIEIEPIYQSSANAVKLEQNEELVGHTIEIKFNKKIMDLSEIKEDDCDDGGGGGENQQSVEHISVALAHVAPKNICREVVIKRFMNNKWVDMPTKDTHFEDIKEYRFVETRLSNKLTTTCLAAVTRLKRERFTCTKKGLKIWSSIDSRISFNIGANVFKVNTDIEIQAQPVELSLISELRSKLDCFSNVLATSPIISLNIDGKKGSLKTPLLVSLPVSQPTNTAKIKRPQTAAVNDKDGKDGASRSLNRPNSAAVSQKLMASSNVDTPDDYLQLVAYVNNNWMFLDQQENIASCPMQSKNKDIVQFEMKTWLNKFYVIRSKNTSNLDAERISNKLQLFLGQKTGQILIRQKNDDPSRVIVQCLASASTKRIIGKLTDDGYDIGPPPTGELILKEGEIVKIAFRGNIKLLDVDKKVDDLRLIYNTQIRSKLFLNLGQVDEFAQKSIEFYRGFVQFFGKQTVKKQIKNNDNNNNNKAPKFEFVDEKVLLGELLVQLPKPDNGPTKPIVKAPIKLKSEDHDVIDELYLRRLSDELGDEWKKLAAYLSLKKVRIQAIMSNNLDTVNQSPSSPIYQMLLTWAKKIPRSVNKVDILSRCLQKIGRLDLVEELKDLDKDFRRQRAQSAKSSYLKKAFVKIVHNGRAATQWKLLAEGLRLDINTVNGIDGEYRGNMERCWGVLNKWKELHGDAVGIDELCIGLRKVKFFNLADEVHALK